jgi:hypothetical protein
VIRTAAGEGPSAVRHAYQFFPQLQGCGLLTAKPFNCMLPGSIQLNTIRTWSGDIDTELIID